ncbi:MAG: LPS export ABC transporter periplasmic protein LptC [Bdellovibrionales bacterium]|nr:LPS export ABC transporter periplasmic protein LptC [Bdellovibrionales bacterium]
MNLKNTLFVILLVALFVEVLVIFPNRLEHKKDDAPIELTRDENAEDKDKDKNKEPDKSKIVSASQKAKGVHLVETQLGSRDWELFSETAEGDQASSWELRNVRVLFYNKEKLSFTVTGDRGSIDGKSKDLHIRGNVVTKSENGYIFKTPSIFYNAKKRQIQSPEKVNMQGPKDEMGDGFVLDGVNMLVLVDENRMTMTQNVRGSKKFKDGKEFFIVSDKADFSGQSRQAKFTGNVEVKYDNLRMQGPAAIFQYKGKTDLINYIQMQGGVRVNDMDKVATAETVNLDLFKNIFTFRGKPKVIQNNDELSGEEIIFLDGGKKVKVEKVRARLEKKD